MFKPAAIFAGHEYTMDMEYQGLSLFCSTGYLMGTIPGWVKGIGIISKNGI